MEMHKFSGVRMNRHRQINEDQGKNVKHGVRSQYTLLLHGMRQFTGLVSVRLQPVFINSERSLLCDITPLPGRGWNCTVFMDTEALNSTPGTRGPDSHSSYVGLVTCVGIRITVVFYTVPAQTLNQEKKVNPWNSYPLTYGTCMCMP